MIREYRNGDRRGRNIPVLPSDPSLLTTWDTRCTEAEAKFADMDLPEWEALWADAAKWRRAHRGRGPIPIADAELARRYAEVAGVRSFGGRRRTQMEVCKKVAEQVLREEEERISPFTIRDRLQRYRKSQVKGNSLETAD